MKLQDFHNMALANGLSRATGHTPLDLGMKCDDDGYYAPLTVERAPRVFGGAKSFAEYDQWQGARAIENQIADLQYTFSWLVDNVMADERMDLGAKASAVTTLARELNSRLRDNAREPAMALSAEMKEAGEDVRFNSVTVGADRYYWLVWSNNFEDGAKEVHTAEAHRKYLDFCDANNAYPDLVLWHLGEKSKLGTTEVMDLLVDPDTGVSMAIAIGKFDNPDYADRLSEWVEETGRPLGASHGYYYSKKDAAQKDGEIDFFITHEISVLPLDAASNKLTAFGQKEESDVNFSDKKRPLAEAILGADAVKEIEASAAALATTGKGLQLRSKEADEQPAAGATAGTAPDAALVSAVAAAIMPALAEGMAPLVDHIVALTTEVKELKEAKAASVDAGDTGEKEEIGAPRIFDFMTKIQGASSTRATKEVTGIKNQLAAGIDVAEKGTATAGFENVPAHLREHIAMLNGSASA